MKIYTAKSSANRAGKAALKKAPEGSVLEVKQIEEGFIFVVIEPEVKPVAEEVGILRVSVVGSPCQLVWQVAEAMEGSKRKDIIAACVEKGIAYYTARTQYQRYREAVRDQA